MDVDIVAVCQREAGIVGSTICWPSSKGSLKVHMCISAMHPDLILAVRVTEAEPAAYVGKNDPRTPPLVGQ